MKGRRERERQREGDRDRERERETERDRERQRETERGRDLLLSLIPMNTPSMTFPPTLQNILSFLDTSSEPLSAVALKRTAAALKRMAAVEHLQEYMHNDHSLL